MSKDLDIGLIMSVGRHCGGKSHRAANLVQNYGFAAASWKEASANEDTAIAQHAEKAFDNAEKELRKFLAECRRDAHPCGYAECSVDKADKGPPSKKSHGSAA